MVLGLKAKARRSPSEKITYLVNIQEIKPWPPSHSLRSIRAVQIQWENGEKNSGSTSSVIPSLGFGVSDGKIVFNESFKLPVILVRNTSVRTGDADVFQKNGLEFSLYEPRRDKTLKGQLLGTAFVDLADYGVMKETLSINVPVNCQRNYKNTAQPLLYIRIQPTDKGRANNSSRSSLTKEFSLEKNGAGSVSDLMKEEYAEEAEINTFSDDDVSSHSSTAVSFPESCGVIPPIIEQGEINVDKNGSEGEEKHISIMETGHSTSNALSTFSAQVNTAASSSCTSSVDLSYDLESPENGHASHSSSPRSSLLSIQRTVMQSADSTYPSLANTQREEESNNETLVQDQEGVDETMETEHNADDPPPICAPSDDSYDESCDKENEDNGLDHDNKVVSSLIEDNHPQQNEKANDMEGTILASTAKEQDTAERDVSSFCEANHGTRESAPSSNRSKNVMSVRSTSDSVQCGGMESSPEESKEVDAGQEVKNGVRSFRTNDRKDVKVYPKDTRSTLLEAKVQQLEHRIQVLENELREVAAVEVSLYSVVAEHGNSMAKVHAPARRLSRMYLHACQHYSLMRRTSAARNIISGLVSVSKACGNDVPRLTYWLSNSIVLRAVISKKVENMEFPSSPVISKERSNAIKGSIKLSPLKWESSPIKKGSDSSDFERPQFLISALEKVEAWIFSRTIESIWWQTLTPYMQSARRKEIDRSMSGSSKNYMEETNMDIQDQGNISMNLWKEAFKDACERLCPVRVAGHECGCLPMLPKLIMEQCVARLDVAMFNALLRESADEIPTDPISDPICDSKVLPIPAGRSSFGAGAQLKNAIGNWSRWLTDLFGMDDDSLEDEERADIDDERQDNSLKSFYLLNALSDLMMLPKDMLLSKSIRKEVCPTFGASLIKRVLNNFVPDEFCPDPIPKVVFEALDYEDPVEAETDSVTAYPYIATPPSYMPPSPASIEEFIGDTGSSVHLRRSGSSVLRKSYTSDDELDELNSPMASILPDGSRSSPVNLKSSWSNGNHQNVLRFDLLREVWSNSE